MASVHRRTTKTGNVVYRCMWVETGRNGTRRQRSKHFSRAADARAYAAQKDQEERRGVGDPDKHTCEQFLRRWLATLRDRDEHSPTTLASYTRCVGMAIREIGHVPLEKLGPAQLDDAYARLRKRGGRTRHKPEATRPLTARTILHVHRCLHTAFEQARKWKMIATNPAADATPPSPGKSKVTAFTADQVKQLLAVAERDPETFAITALFLACGLRRSEVLGLTFDALDLDAASLSILRTVVAVDHKPVLRERAKTEASLRTIAIPLQLAELLRQQKARVQAAALKWGKGYQREPMLLFPGLAGAPRLPQSLTDRMRQVMRRAKIVGPSPCHAWRHTSATALLDAGQNIKTVQARLGHSSPAITLSLYVHPTDERDRAAADHFDQALKR
jgi:integrase